MTEKSNKKITKGRAANQSQNSSRKKDNGARGNKVSEQLKAAKELQKTEAKKARPEHVVNLIADALWLMGLAATLYLTISLISFDMGDPSWSRSSPIVEDAANWGGLFGAYIADVGYYLFGWSFWWWIVAACVMLYKNFRLHAKPTLPGSYNHKIAVAALFILTVFSPVLEYFVLGGKYSESLPVGAGGMVGIRVGAIFAWLLGKSGSLLIILVVLLLSVSLLVQVSWLEVLNGTSRTIQNCLAVSGRKISSLGKRRPNTKKDSVDTLNTRRMVKEAKNITAKPVISLEGSTSNRKSVAVSVAPPPKIQASLFEDNEVRSNGEYHKPALNLLRLPDNETVSINPAELERTAELIESKLAEFGIGVQVVSATSGPVITRYEIEPAQGIKGSQIVALSKDLARSMSLQSVRIVETIAGKNTMGIE